MQFFFKRWRISFFKTRCCVELSEWSKRADMIKKHEIFSINGNTFFQNLVKCFGIQLSWFLYGLSGIFVIELKVVLLNSHAPITVIRLFCNGGCRLTLKIYVDGNLSKKFFFLKGKFCSLSGTKNSISYKYTVL